MKIGMKIASQSRRPARLVTRSVAASVGLVRSRTSRASVLTSPAPVVKATSLTRRRPKEVTMKNRSSAAVKAPAEAPPQSQRDWDEESRAEIFGDARERSHHHRRRVRSGGGGRSRRVRDDAATEGNRADQGSRNRRGRRRLDARAVLPRDGDAPGDGSRGGARRRRSRSSSAEVDHWVAILALPARRRRTRSTRSRRICPTGEEALDAPADRRAPQAAQALKKQRNKLTRDQEKKYARRVTPRSRRRFVSPTAIASGSPTPRTLARKLGERARRRTRRSEVDARRGRRRPSPTRSVAGAAARRRCRHARATRSTSSG